MLRRTTVVTSCLLPAILAGAADFYVSPAGSDTNSGTPAAPFATLERARTEIRSLKSGPGLPAGGVNVWLRGGVYTRTNTFELSASDAGAPATPIAWRGFTGEEARVVGAVQLDPSWFSAVTNGDPVWSRLDTNAQGRVMQADLPAHGITNYGTLKVRGFYGSVAAALELFFTNAPMPLARYPDPDENEPAQTFTNAQLTIFGDPGPLDVTGLYTNSGISDGVNKYARVGLVGTNQYNLYRYYWQHEGTWYRAWFLTTHTGGYPSTNNPWWCRYTPELGPMNATSQSGSTGTPRFDDPARISYGWLAVNTVPGGSANTNVFTYAGTRPERWSQAEEPWFHGFWRYQWADQHQKGVSIDTVTKTITLGTIPTYGIAAGQPYYAENLLEEITRPGEWYLNRANGRLYFWPPAPLAGADIWVSQLEQPLWRLKDTTNVTVHDLTLDMSRTELAVIEGGTRNVFLHCTLRNAGCYASRVSGTSNGVSSCTILHPGEGGAALSGANSRTNLVPVRNFMRNCTVRDFSRWSWTYQPAALINPEAVGCWVAHNDMRDSPHTAILFGRCNDNLIEFNRVGNVCLWSSDAGAIYIGRDWGARGNVIRYNFVHDVDSLFEGYGTHGVYLDDCQSGVQVFGNVLYRVSDNALMMGGGRDNLMENNVIARCGKGIAADARGAGWMYDNGGTSNLWAELQKLPYRSALWSNAYPLCAAIPNNWPSIVEGNWRYPEGCVFSRNLGFSNGVFQSQSDNALAYFQEITNNLADADPLFVDEAGLNLTLKTDSPAYTIPGFQPIPFDRIGLESNLTLSVQIRGAGSVAATPAQPDYYPMQFVHLAAAPSNLWYFSSWTGSVSDTSAAVSVWMTNDLALTAVFRPFTVTNDTAIWWLLQYGLATNDAGALADSDGDGCLNWQEYIAGTNPTNAASRFVIRPVTAAREGIALAFPGASNRFYDVEYRADLLDTNGWRLLTNAAPAADALLEIMDPSQGPSRFYRVRARML